MATQRIHIVREFNAPVAKLFAFLSDHDNLSFIFAPAKVTRTQEGATSKNGVGSKRKLVLPLLPSTEETVTNYVQDRLIEYRISNFSVLKNHMGTMLFKDLGNNRSQLEYFIEFDGRLPFAAKVLERVIDRAIRSGLDKIPL